jgi:hypothetical protein
MSRYYITLPNPSAARGTDPALAFRSQGAEGFAAELQDALAGRKLFDRWKMKQEDPDAVDETMAATDPSATVKGAQHDLKVDLEVNTTLPSQILRHRLRLLAGNHWQLRDVTA